MHGFISKIWAMSSLCDGGCFCVHLRVRVTVRRLGVETVGRQAGDVELQGGRSRNTSCLIGLGLLLRRASSAVGSWGLDGDVGSGCPT